MASGESERAGERARVGLCWDCRWARRVQSGRGSVFFLCRRAEFDPAYARYPRLPVSRCPGYEPENGEGEDERARDSG